VLSIFPVRAIVIAPRSFALSRAEIIFGDVPLVVIPITTSPDFTHDST